MNLPSVDQTLQYVALFLAVVEFILALYVLVLNPRHTANRHASVLLFLGALTTLGQALLLGADAAAEAYPATVILAATVVSVLPMLSVTAIALLKPEWLKPPAGTRGRWILVSLKYFFYLLALLPIALTLIDVAMGTQLWYTGLDSRTYAKGDVVFSDFTAGIMSAPLRILAFQIVSLLNLVPLLYVALWDKKVTRSTRRLAWVLLAAQALLIFATLGLQLVFPEPFPSLLATAIFVFAYTYVVFRQMASGRHIPRGRLRPRLTALILVVAVPLMIVVPMLLSFSAGNALEQGVTDQLQTTNRALGANLSVWLDLNLKALQNLTVQPDIVGMDAQQQKPVLETMAAAYPHMYLISTTNLDGTNIARNDDADPKDYGDRTWFRSARSGAPLTLQSLVGRTSGRPAIVASMPIVDQAGGVIGVSMFASDLADVAGEVQVSQLGETGFSYVVDATNQAIAHPDPAYSAELRDLGGYPPVAALRQGQRGQVAFTDEAGLRWQAYVDELDNGWGVIVQQQESELLGLQQSFQGLTWTLIAAGTVILLILTWLTISQAFRPISSLTRTASTIATGDLSAKAPIESEDEIGTLALTFNNMTDQLRGLIDSLEDQVAERTQDLVQRTSYLEATAEVGRAAASILDTDQLLQQAVDLIRQRFDLYYVGLFLTDEAGQWAVLRAGTGTAGRAMLARNHRIRTGEGMVGWAVAQGQPRVALEAGEDAVRLATAELPETRSEAALPLRSRGQVLGALTVQHTQSGAFDEATMGVLQTMADQVAVAISNALLFQQAQEALESTRQAYGDMGREAWHQLLSAQAGMGYYCDEHGVFSLHGGARSAHEARQAQDNGGQPELELPVQIHGRTLGTIKAHKPEGSGAWTADEVELMRTLNGQLGVALEGARLYQDTQQRAARDRLLSEATARMRASLDVQDVLRSAAGEMRQALDLDRMVVRLATPEDSKELGQDPA